MGIFVSTCGGFYKHICMLTTSILADTPVKHFCKIQCMATYAKRLSKARSHAGLNQSELARRIGVKPQSIQYLEDESKEAQGSTHTPAIARECGVSADWLASGTGEMIPTGLIAKAMAGKENPEIVDVPRLSVRASAGLGVDQPDGDHIVGTIQLPVEFIRRRMNCSAPKNLRTIMAYGDSMVDTFGDGDVIFVDVGARQIDVDGIYVAQINGELFIKRFQRRPMENSLVMISDNRSKYDPQVISADRIKKIEILGRAIWVWNGRKL